MCSGAALWCPAAGQLATAALATVRGACVWLIKLLKWLKAHRHGLAGAAFGLDGQHRADVRGQARRQQRWKQHVASHRIERLEHCELF